jgi:predicted transcriptional regulator
MRMREIAEAVGITERAVQRIIADLRDEKYIRQKRTGRCNTYHVNTRKRLKHPIESHRTLKDLIGLIFD